MDAPTPPPFGRRKLLLDGRIEKRSPMVARVYLTLRGIAPGDYKLFAWEDIEADAYLDADFLQSYEERGVTIRVEEIGRYSTRLKLISADVVPR